jgi:hypothetical protein
MKNNGVLQLFILCFFGLTSTITFGQKVELAGKLTNEDNNNSLFGVNVSVKNTVKGVVTDENGNFSISLTPGSYTFEFSYLGFETIKRKIKLTENRYLKISLQPNQESLNEVIIEQNREALDLRDPQMSTVSLNPETIENTPVVLGETDPIKALQLLPGISGNGEGSSGFNVRGGSGAQNLILLDQATLFNSSHLFGFFSVVNADAISGLDLYKGGIPSRFGGRGSSVLDISQKAGNKNQLAGNGSIGIVSSKLTLEGPIEKGKSSFLVSGRSSYAHLFLKLVDNPNSAYFYDLNAKLDFDLSETDQLYFSGYFGRDVFNINDSFKNNYGNAVASLRWEHIFNKDITSNLYLIFSDYNFDLNLDVVGFNYNSGVRNFNLKYHFNHFISDDFSLNYGLSSKYTVTNPGFIEPDKPSSGITSEQFTKKYSVENSAYVEVNQQLTPELKLTYGARFSNFLRLGQDSLNLYANDRPVIYNQNLNIYEEAPIESTISQSRGSVTKTFNNIEPRISLAYKFAKDESIKANYQRMNQYLQLLTTTNSPTPLDIWNPSGRYIKPLQTDQWALGYYRKFRNLGLDLETEIYYKDTKNRIDYINGAQLIANDATERVLLNGKSRAYGLEILVKKTMGKFTGWLAYTLSKSEQKTPGRTAVEPGINDGNWYASPWDKRHDFSLTGNYDYSDKWSVNAAFVYQTGRPANFPQSKYTYNGLTVPTYAGRNQSRLPDFHHLDLSATYTPKPNDKKGWRSKWVFSIYNVYNRKNALTIDFAKNEDAGVNEATKLSIFGIIPSVSYKFKF